MRRLIRAILTVAVTFAAARSWSATYAVTGNPATDTVSFASSASLEFIEGTTTKISGSFDFDPAGPDSIVGGILSVDLASLRTGIELRDEHMREKHLQTDKYPNAYFQLLSVTSMPTAIVPGQVYSVTGDGYFYIHGVKRKITPKIQFELPADADSSSV